MRRVAINAQVSPKAGSGGVSYALAALVSALGKLQDGPEEYVVIGPHKDSEWLRPYLGPNAVLVPRPMPGGVKHGIESRLKSVLRRVFVTGSPPQGYPGRVPVSDGFYESLGCEVILFPYQQFEICAMPSVYCPHDLQHLRYPQFFRPKDLANRETIYPAGCRFAHTVAVASQWIKDDIRRNYQIDPNKIQIIPWGPPSFAGAAPAAEALERTRIKYGLEQPFVFYPAVAWPHKNHTRLLQAIALLAKRHDQRFQLVCSGGSSPEMTARIQREAAALNIRNQVGMLGTVEPDELRAIYRLAEFVVFPSLFEGGAMPMLEAWLEGTPLACSSATMMPEQAGDAALLFDPTSPEAIAEAMLKLRMSDDLRSELIKRGAERLKAFSWDRTAKAYRATFRRAAGWPLTEEDRTILSWNWMIEPAPPLATRSECPA